MGQATSFPIRREIISRYSLGESFSSISQNLCLSYGTVRNLCKSYDLVGDAALDPGYSRCGNRSIRSDAFVYRASCFLKYYHRDWGAEYILTRIRLKYPDLSLPRARTLQRWFVAKGLNKKRLKIRDESPWGDPPVRAEAVHQIRQVDAKEHQQTLDGQKSCYLSTNDEYSGAALKAKVFPL